MITTSVSVRTTYARPGHLNRSRTPHRRESGTSPAHENGPSGRVAACSKVGEPKPIFMSGMFWSTDIGALIS